MPFVPSTRSCSVSVTQVGGIIPWAAGLPYVTGNVVYYDDTIYLCLTDHTSTANFLTDRDTSGYWRAFDSEYTHIQSSPSTTWTITHNLGRRPNVSLINGSNEVVEGSIVHTSINVVTVTFNSSLSGIAECS
jgi:hypothetical protein